LVDMFVERSYSADLSIYRSIPKSAPFQSFDELEMLNIPTIILANQNDPLHPFAYGTRLAAAIPGAHLHEFPSKSESLELHRCGFRELIGNFLNGLRESGN